MEKREGKSQVWPWSATVGINSDVSLVVIIHSFSSDLLSLSCLEGPGIDVVQGKARLAFWLLGDFDTVKSSEHII